MGVIKKRLRNILIVGASVLFLILVLGFLSFHSTSAEKRVVALLQRHIAKDCRVGAVSLSLWRGLFLKDLFITVPDLNGFSLTLKVAETQVSIALIPLLFHHFRATHIEIKGLEVVGKMVEKNISEKNGPKTSNPPSFSVKKISVDDGSVLFRNKEEILLKGEGLRFRTRISGSSAPEAKGYLRFEEVVLSEEWKFTRCRILFRADDSTFVLKKLHARVLGGQIMGSGDFLLNPAKMKSGEISLKGIQLREYYSLREQESGELEGEIKGKFIFKKSALSPKSLRGSGKIEISRFSAVDIPLQRVALVKNFMPGLADLSFQKANATLVLDTGGLWLDPLMVEGKLVTIESRGPINFDGKFSQTAQVSLSEVFAQELSVWVRNALEKDESGVNFFECNLSGTFLEPKVKLAPGTLNRAIGITLNQAGRKIGKFFKSLFK